MSKDLKQQAIVKCSIVHPDLLPNYCWLYQKVFNWPLDHYMLRVPFSLLNSWEVWSLQIPRPCTTFPPRSPVYRVGVVGRKILNCLLQVQRLGTICATDSAALSHLDLTRLNHQPNQILCFKRHWTPLVLVYRILPMMAVSCLTSIEGPCFAPAALAWQFRCSCMLRTDKRPRSSHTPLYA